MTTLSTPIGELKSEYDVVVVGSGYGGAIAACGMAEAKYSVCVLERGIERQAGDYPSTITGAIKDIQADAKIGRIGSRTALFDFRMNRDVSVLVGCGLGGTSLINAAVMLEPTEEVFKDKRWPKGLPDKFKPYFGSVKNGLGVADWPSDLGLEKVEWLRSGAKPTPVSAAPVAISFTTKVNDFGVQQQRCVLCGNCISGCNHSAKNTVATNYLPRAANADAAIFCGVETRSIEQANDAIEQANDGWLVHVRLNDKVLSVFGNPEFVVRARMVFLAAGTLGSTEILLRSRVRHRLPLSDKIGQRFSGNGDVIAFGYNAPERVNGVGYGSFVPRKAAVGPTIAAMADERSGADQSGAMIQEGAIPGALRWPLRFAAPIMARATHLLADTSFDLSFRHIWREIDTMIRGTHHGALARTQTFLAMGHDDGDGEMRLRADRLRINWDHAKYHDVYKKISRRLQQITRKMKGRYVINPFWSRLFGRRLMTVHPLGGCCLADSAADGVVNAKGEVFNGSGVEPHKGLYVCDGSIIPMPLGTNPSLTISALAEHIVKEAIASNLPPDAPKLCCKPSRVVRSVPGIQYGERMRGRMTLLKQPTRVEAILHISASSVDELIKGHEARVIGIVRTPDLEPARQRWTVSDGTLDVLIDDPRSVDTKLLVYRLTLTADDGTKRWLRGHKVVNLATLRRHFWSSLTRVPFVIFDVEPTERLKRDRQNIWRLVEKWDSKGGAAPKGTCGAGAMRSTVTDAMRLGLSIRIVRERSLWKRLRWRYRFTWWFAKTVIQLRVWALRTTRSINPFDPDELKKSYVDRGLFGKEINYPRDNPRMRLTQYWGTSKTPPTRPPVILAPGFGMSTLCFHSAGENSFAQYLRTKGYDVWLFDYRASDKLDVSLDQFDIDQLAHDDFPRAIEEVFGCTKRPVHIVAHCLASMIMQMSLLAGKIETEHVRSMLLSQSFAFIDLPWPTRLKVRLHLPELLQYMNSRPVVTSDFDRRSTFGTRLLDRLLYFFPSDERCHEGVCRRLLLLYGEVVRHDHLDQATHESFYHLFDRGNLSAFKHIGRMFILGHIADKNGNNIYLDPKNGPNVNVPITLLQGTANRMFLPSGARKTLHWLRQHGASDLPVDKHKLFTLEHTDGYGHLDNFIGKNAKRDVFPTIVAALERMNGTPSRCVWWSS